MRILIKSAVTILMLLSARLSAQADTAVVVATTNLPLSGVFTADGPYLYEVGQRFTTDSSSDQVIRGLGVYIADVTSGRLLGWPRVDASIVPDDHGHPVTGYGYYPTNALAYPTGGVFEYDLHANEINYFGGGEVDLLPNTSYWAIFAVTYYSPSQPEDNGSVQFGTVSVPAGRGTGDWLTYSNDYVSGQLALDSHYETSQFALASDRLLDIVISRDAFEPTPEPSTAALFLLGVILCANSTKSSGNPSRFGTPRLPRSRDQNKLERP
jgi:hypothetical protein